MPTYERTHPWISFRFDFSRASAQLWLLLGEAQSKCEHSIKSEAVAIGEIMNLSPRIAREYAGKSHRTLQRDLSILVRLDLIERTSTDVRAKKEIILAFLP